MNHINNGPNHFFSNFLHRHLNRILLLSLSYLASMPSMADGHYRSGATKVSVVELYTSEGCSSCPPADRWLSELTQSDGLFESVIPLAFHVDYWNDLGWRDEFSDAAYSSRQRRYQQLGHSKSVYTPGFIVDGQEWRGFFRRTKRNLPPSPNEDVGNLILSEMTDAYRVSFEPADAGLAEEHDLVVHIAYLGNGIRRQIKRGENAGKELTHDFVVLAMGQATLSPQKNMLVGSINRAEINDATAVAAWVSRSDDPTPIQA
ncbi:MAG: hypothetical protein ACI9Z9_002818, partial [Litorivivens sp.]